MSIIHFSIAFKALDTFVAQHNATADSLSTRLRQPVIATAREIIRIYGASLLKVSKKTSFNASDIPPLKTNNVQLAKLSHVSTRTIKRHLKKLVQANVITEKIFYGRKANYALFLNPKILLINCQKPVDKTPIQEKAEKTKNTDNQSFKKHFLTSCPQTDSSNNKINNIIIAVDKKLDADNQRSSLSLTANYLSGNKTGNNFTRYAEKESIPKMTELPTQDTLGARNFYQKESIIHKEYKYNQFHNDAEKEGKPLEVQTQAKDTDSRLGASRVSFLTSYTEKLWEFARQSIYKDQFLNSYQITTAKKLLFDWYIPVKDQHLEKVHQVYMTRLKLVKKYLDKDREKRFVQLPDRYFDTKNPFGFTGTKVWYENQIRSKQKTRAKLITHAQIRRFVNNEQNQTSKQKPWLTLFRDCEKKVQKLQNPQLLDQFYKRVLEYTS